ncbi:arginine deiminase [Streptacidiphilus pinicola]|uniref:Arginine deiminase n=1 Tax=Streptacidiphilus pinicola TaxID=2219663 RepID=A0A2X0KDU8_9ACTN|nr:arginine deiminase [Streptacidiphilus pinicola]RAG85070.1 arginine deiminase [Streptacidiphilus pinicola]
MYQVNSEVGVLRQVILHEPGLEFERLTPDNKDALLFDDVVWVERAQQEHQAFQQIFRNRGVTVHLLQDLLTETLKSDEAVSFMLGRVLDGRQAHMGAVLAAETRRALTALGPGDLAAHLIGGLNKRELREILGERPSGARSLGLDVLADDEFVLTPLPNALFTRDTSCWIYDGVSVNPMMMTGRSRETVAYEAIYDFHPQFADRAADRWTDGEAMAPAAIEGGDVAVLGNGTVLVGLGERTTPAGIEHLAMRLFAAGAANRVIVAELPKSRAVMHLDTVLTMVDTDAFVLFSELDRATLRSWTLTPGSRWEPTITENKDLFAEIGTALGLSSVRVLQSGKDSYSAHREQWNDGCNLLALAPGTVIAYEINDHSNRMLEENGIEVLRLQGDQLGRGRGGPRCMSCPIERDAA